MRQGPIERLSSLARFRARVHLRRGSGSRLKPGLDWLDGIEIDFQRGHEIEDGLYKGEVECLPDYDFQGQVMRAQLPIPLWIASGDLVFLAEIGVAAGEAP